MSASSHHQSDSAGSGPAAIAPGHSTSGAVAPFVVDLPLAGLRLWPGNPRKIRPERLEDLKRAMLGDREMLSARPLLALPDGTVIAGNQRLLAAQELAWETIPVLTVDLDPKRARLWALRDNNQFGEWDQPALAELLSELEGGVDLALTGFAGGEIDTILAGLPVADVDPDEAVGCQKPVRVTNNRRFAGETRVSAPPGFKASDLLGE